MSGKPWYSKDQVLEWHREYLDHTKSAKSVSSKFNIKHDTMLNHFRRLNLHLRPKGFRINNCQGKDGKDNIRLRYLWFFNFGYKRRAARKDYEVTITDDQFITLVTSNCHYCNKDWQTETRLVGNRPIKMLTVDRKDSKIRYTPENCVSCCKLCNTIKMDMGYDQFKDQIRKIMSHLKL